MTIDLDKDDLISLVLGTTPYYDVFEHPLVKRGGEYIDGFIEEWYWHGTHLEEMSCDELAELYKVCKNSWK